MAWVVDTNVLFDVALNDPAFGMRSLACLKQHRADGLIVSPITYAELAPLYAGAQAQQDAWLTSLGIGFRTLQTWDDVQCAWTAFGQCVARKKAGAGRIPPRRVSDMLVGAFGLRHQGLITRNAADFRTNFPSLPIVTP